MGSHDASLAVVFVAVDNLTYHTLAEVRNALTTINSAPGIVCGQMVAVDEGIVAERATVCGDNHLVSGSVFLNHDTAYTP